MDWTPGSALLHSVCLSQEPGGAGPKALQDVLFPQLSSFNGLDLGFVAPLGHPLMSKFLVDIQCSRRLNKVPYISPEFPVPE